MSTKSAILNRFAADQPIADPSPAHVTEARTASEMIAGCEYELRQLRRDLQAISFDTPKPPQPAVFSGAPRRT